MAAKNVTVFLPRDCDGRMVFDALVSGLGLSIESVPVDKILSSKLSASDGRASSYVVISYYEESRDMIDELLVWDKPRSIYKDKLARCRGRLSIDYRDPRRIGSAFDLIGSLPGASASQFVVENGLGCLLTVEDVVVCLKRDPAWSWEKEAFPELPEVAESEWKD